MCKYEDVQMKKSNYIPYLIRIPARLRWLLLLMIGGFAHLLVCTSAFAQQTKIDSLLAALKTAKEDTDKVNTLNALAWRSEERRVGKECRL